MAKSEQVYNIDWVWYPHAAVNIESVIVQKNMNVIHNSSVCKQAHFATNDFSISTQIIAALPVLPLATRKRLQLHNATQTLSLPAAN